MAPTDCWEPAAGRRRQRLVQRLAPALRSVVAVLTLGALLAAGCTAVGAPPGLDGRDFLSTGVVENGNDRPLVAGTRIRLTFRDGTQLGASAGCNSIGGTYRIDGGILRFEGAGMTDMGCDEDRHAQDDWLVAFLAAGPQVVLAGNDLTLSTATTRVTLVDEEIADPDLPLVGTRWVVDGLIDGDMVAGFADGPRATIQITPDGQIDVATGCNQGTGTVAADGSTLRITGLALTKRACVDGAAALEAGVLAVLSADAVSWTIDGHALTLMAGSRGLTLRG